VDQKGRPGSVTAELVAVAAAAVANGARIAADQAARWRHWRVGRWGRLLCLRARLWGGRRGGGCLRCGTDYRYVLPHDTPIDLDRALFPLCEGCWLHLGKQGRRTYYGIVLNQWRADGRYQDRPELWDADRTAVYAAVEAGL
jgi:hypothetical protein